LLVVHLTIKAEITSLLRCPTNLYQWCIGRAYPAPGSKINFAAYLPPTKIAEFKVKKKTGAKARKKQKQSICYCYFCSFFRHQLNVLALETPA